MDDYESLKRGIQRAFPGVVLGEDVLIDGITFVPLG